MKRAFREIPWTEGRDPERVTAINDYLKRYWEELNGKREVTTLEPDVREKPYVAPPPACAQCNDMGLVGFDVPLGDPLFGKMQACPHCRKGQDMAREQWRRKYLQAELPRQFQGFTFDSWNDMLQGDMDGKRIAYMAALQFVENPGHEVDLYAAFTELGMPWEEGRDLRPKNSLVLWGEMGTGKSGLMSAAVNELLARGELCLYARLDEFIEEYRATYNETSEKTTEEVMSKYKRYPVLFLDEMNMFGVSNDVLNKIEALLRYRYNNNMPTLLTTNLDQDAFLDMWQGRSGDAVSAMAHWIHVGGMKLRRTDPSVYDWQERKDVR